MLAVAACIKGKIAIFSIYNIKKLSARRHCLQQWRDRDFRYTRCPIKKYIRLRKTAETLPKYVQI